MENKEHILKLLLICLQETRAGEDIIGLQFRSVPKYEEEFVDICYSNGFSEQVNVTADSGLAMIHSVVEALY